jgi:hypothetical protein
MLGVMIVTVAGRKSDVTAHGGECQGFAFRIATSV